MVEVVALNSGAGRDKVKVSVIHWDLHGPPPTGVATKPFGQSATNLPAHAEMNAHSVKANKLIPTLEGEYSAGVVEQLNRDIQFHRQRSASSG